MAANIVGFLDAIKPGLTIYGVLLTFALVSFAVGRHFWRYEGELIRENIDRLKDLMNNYRGRHIEPLVKQQLSSAVEGAYEIAINGLLEDLHPKVTTSAGEIQRQPVDNPTLSKIISQDALSDRLKELKRAAGYSNQEFLESASGERLFSDLDRVYEQRKKLSERYTRARGFCARTCYSFLALSLLLLVGMLAVVQTWPSMVNHLWFFFSALFLLYGIYSFVRLETARRELLHDWEELQLHGEV